MLRGNLQVQWARADTQNAKLLLSLGLGPPEAGSGAMILVQMGFFWAVIPGNAGGGVGKGVREGKKASMRGLAEQGPPQSVGRSPTRIL